MAFGLYVHIPFCVHRCSYCDFYTLTDFSKDPSHERYGNALLTEIDGASEVLAKKTWGGRLTSIFFGGGTPSLVPVSLLSTILARARFHFGFEKDIEITVEANPESVTQEWLSALADTDVNRVSLGTQSFQARHLKTLERLCTPERVIQAVDLLSRTRFQNFNLDLIFGIPDQTQQELISDIQMAATLAPKHISFYSLTLTAGHVLYASLPTEEKFAEFYEAGCGELERLGYPLYEISNFAQPGFESRHNLLYWTGGDYLGIGPSAASRFFDGSSFHHRKNRPDLAQYMIDPAVFNQWEITTQFQTQLEAVFLEMRQHRGIQVEDFAKRYGYDPRSARKFSSYLKQGLLEYDEDYLRLSKKGRLLADRVTSDLVDPL